MGTTKATEILDAANAAAAAAKVLPAAALQAVQVAVNALIVEAGFPVLLAKIDADAGTIADTYVAGDATGLGTNGRDIVTRFNALLAALDTDALGVSDYAATLTATAETLGAKWNALLAKLDLDSAVTGTDYAAKVPLTGVVTPLNG